MHMRALCVVCRYCVVHAVIMHDDDEWWCMVHGNLVSWWPLGGHGDGPRIRYVHRTAVVRGWRGLPVAERCPQLPVEVGSESLDMGVRVHAKSHEPSDVCPYALVTRSASRCAPHIHA
jgi:hypothetical protein